MIDVKKLRCLCAVRFLRKRIRTDFCSQKKKMDTRSVSKTPCMFVTNTVRPSIMPKRMTKKMDKIRP